MKKIIVLFLGSVLLLLSSCSPKINGATKHRRDRNCGCERLDSPQCSPAFFEQTAYYWNQSNSDKNL